MSYPQTDNTWLQTLVDKAAAEIGEWSDLDVEAARHALAEELVTIFMSHLMKGIDNNLRAYAQEINKYHSVAGSFVLASNRLVQQMGLPYVCPQCLGDCSAANPPVNNCPMKPWTQR